MSLESKTCLITGAARGIGAATARALAKTGWRVIITYLHSDAEALALVSDIKADGNVADCIQADVTNRDDMQRVHDWLVSQGLELQALIHNAAAPFQRGATSRVAWSPVFTSQLDTSCQGFLNAVQVLQPRMAKDCLIIALLTSALTVHDGAETAAYLAGKGALMGLCQGWHRELTARGRRLIFVSPGATRTDLLLRSSGTHPRQIELLDQTLAQADAATPEDIGRQLCIIVSNAAQLSFSGHGPLHLVVDKHAIRRLEWALHDVVP